MIKLVSLYASLRNKIQTKIRKDFWNNLIFRSRHSRLFAFNLANLAFAVQERGDIGLMVLETLVFVPQEYRYRVVSIPYDI